MKLQRQVLITMIQVLIGLTLTACMEVKDPEQAKSQNIQQSSNSHLAYSIPDSGDFNHFEVHLTMPNNDYVLMRKVIAKDAEEALNKTPDFRTKANSIYIDKDVKPGTDYLYSIGKQEGLKYVEEDSVLVSVPVDIQVEKNTQLIISASDLKLISNLARIRKLVLSQGSEIVTNGQNLLIKVRELISVSGKISAFNMNSTATTGTNGQNAGTLTLFAENAEGDLEIHLNGQAGGSGQKGSDGQNYKILAGKGGAGGNGGAGGEFRYSLPTNGRINLKVFTKGGLKGSGGPGGNGASWRYCGPRGAGGECSSESIPAGPKGDDGKEGLDGVSCEAVKHDINAILDINNYNCHP